jgi:hypothetical protein
MLLPPAATADYYSQVKGAKNNPLEGGYVFPCDSVLPDLTVQMIGGISAVVPGHFVNRSVSQTPGSSSCYGGIQQGSPTLSIWGDVFLKSQFAVFDGRDPPRIGFAKQAADVPTINRSMTAAPVGNATVPTNSSGSALGAKGPPPQINWVSYLLRIATKWGIMPKDDEAGVIGERKRSAKFRYAI